MANSSTNGVKPNNPRIGLVLSGGGARGAYEAGVMSVLGPALAARGERPTIYIGTTVGAVNAAYLAASEHLPADEAGEGGARALARGAARARSIRPILLRQAPLTALRYAGEILSLPGVRLPSLLDPKPFERNLDRWIDWDAVHRNVDDGRRRGRRRPSRPLPAPAAPSCSSRATHERITHRSHAIDYVTDAARRPARARVGGDPDPVPAGAGRAARARRAGGTSTAARGSTRRSSRRSTSAPSG